MRSIPLGGAQMALSVYVKVDKSMKIVNGLEENVLVGEIISELSASCRCTKPQVLLEVWNGCSRPFHNDDRLFESLNKWGNQLRTINLVMMDKDKYFNGGFPIKDYERDWRRNRRKKKRYCTFKISHRKLPIAATSKQRLYLCRELKLKLQKLIKEIQLEQDSLRELSEKTEQLSTLDLTKLSPALQGRYTALSNEITKVTLASEELSKHKKELHQALINREQEIGVLQRNIMDVQKQANMEMMKKQEKSLQEEQKLYDLKSRLKARQKISQLQSEKMKEILNIKSLLELQLQDCTEQIQSIKMNTDKKLDIV